ARFVAQRPADDTGMILEAVYHVFYEINAMFRPYPAVSGNEECQSVRFKIVFAHNQNAHFVAKAVKNFAVGIMACSYRRYVVFKAKLKVFFDKLFGYGVPVFGMEFMPVHPAELQRFAVQENERTFAVFHFLYF